MRKDVFISICVVLSSCFSVPESTEQKIAYDEYTLSQFVKTSATQSLSISTPFLDSVLIKAGTDSIVFHKTVNYLTRAYADPNSSFRNEIFYDKILKAQMDSKWNTDWVKKEAIRKRHLLHQNDVGSLANNFEYLAPNGQKRSMHNLKANYILLFFYNPECHACKEMKATLLRSSIIRNAILDGKLKILSVYTDADLSVWYKHLLEFPSNWLQGRDNDRYLYKNDIYDLRAIPTIYLLDQHKKVILKDCTSINELEGKIQ